MPQSEFAKHVEEVLDLQRLLIDTDDAPGVQHYVKPTSSAELVLYLGCNILRTPHLALEAIAAFESLGSDFVPIAGPQFCCGVVHQRAGDRAGADRLLQSNLARTTSYAPDLAAVWCPTCLKRYDEAAASGSGPEFRYASAHTFLAERAAELDLRPISPHRVVLHHHIGTPRQEADAGAVLRLLGTLPGVEVIGTAAAHDLDYHCSPAIRLQLGEWSFQEKRRRMLEDAKAKGADTLVTLYHSCHRQWSDAGTGGLEIRNYVSLLAEAMGHSHVDAYRAFMRLEEPDAAVALARRLGVARHLSDDHVRQLATRYFT